MQLGFTAARQGDQAEWGRLGRDDSAFWMKRGTRAQQVPTQAKALMQCVTLFPHLEIMLNWGCIS